MMWSNMLSVNGKECLMALLKREVSRLRFQSISYDTLGKRFQIIKKIDLRICFQIQIWNKKFKFNIAIVFLKPDINY